VRIATELAIPCRRIGFMFLSINDVANITEIHTQLQNLRLEFECRCQPSNIG